MSDNYNDIEPQNVEKKQAETPTKPSNVFSALSRTLSEEDYSVPGVQKLIVNMIDELNTVKLENKQYINELQGKLIVVNTENNSNARKLAIYKEKLKKHSFWEVFDTICSIIGGTLIGFVSNDKLGIGVGFCGFILMLISIVGKVILYKNPTCEEN